MIPEVGPGQGCVLLVDDEPNVLATLRRLLERRGFSVMTEADPSRVEARLISEHSQQTVDAAIIDLRMPEMDGTELLARLISLDSDLPVLVLTGFGSLSDARQAAACGAFDFLVKPADPEQIVTALTRAIAWRRSRRSSPGGGAVPIAGEGWPAATPENDPQVEQTRSVSPRMDPTISWSPQLWALKFASVQVVSPLSGAPFLLS